jgi:hypothetical protein
MRAAAGFPRLAGTGQFYFLKDRTTSSLLDTSEVSRTSEVGGKGLGPAIRRRNAVECWRERLHFAKCTFNPF